MATLTITHRSLPTPTGLDITKKNLIPITSYNWLDDRAPTIVVPGSPNLWTPPHASSTILPADSGFHIISQNAHRVPHSPLEPLFRAVPSLPLKNQPDIVTDRNNLRKLLNFVAGKRDSFRIELQRVGATTLFQRCDCASSEVIVGFRGFGSEFEKKFTLATVEGAKAHHRVVQYQMGGLGMLVRFEVDAMVGEDDYEEGEEEDEEQMGSLRVRRVGYNVVPGDVVAEIKTRSINRVLDMGDVMPQLWFSETQWLLVAYHRRGAFWKRDMEQVNVERNGMLREWEEGNKGNLEKLVRLLKVVIEAVVEAGGRAELAVTEDGILRVSGSRGGDLVPGDIMDTLEM